MSIFSYTGNPFVDSGIAAIMAYCNKKRIDDITLDDINSVSELIKKLYIEEQWIDCLNKIFPNNSVTNPSYKTKKIKQEKLKAFLDELVLGINQLGNYGDCIGCGRRDAQKTYSKTYIPLTGSGSLRNFYSFAQSGADYCSTCVFAIQASPLVYYMCGKLMLILIHSSNFNVVKSWAKLCIEKLNKQIALNSFEGCYNDGYTNPINAVFHIAGLLLDKFESELEDGTDIVIYYFSNFNRKPELDIYYLPSNIFNFLKYMNHPLYKSEWAKIVKKGYNIENNKKVDENDEETYKNLKNQVYIKLLNGESILSYFFLKAKRQVIGNFKMLSIYLKEVEGMDEKRIEVIKNVADKIAEHIKRTNNLKRLSKLEMSKTSYEFRNQLRLITKEKLVLKDDEPLFSLDEYVEYLFPDNNWKETQDLILFRIYEKLFEWLKENNIEEIKEELEKEEEE